MKLEYLDKVDYSKMTQVEGLVEADGSAPKIDVYVTHNPIFSQNGYLIHVRNKDNVPRNYSFRIAGVLYPEEEEKVLTYQESFEVEAVKPNYTAVLKVNAPKGENKENLVLEDIYVYGKNPDGTRNTIAHYDVPDERLHIHADKNGSPPSKTTKTGKFLMVALPVVALAIGSYAYYLNWQEKRSKEKKYSPLQEAKFDLADSKMEIFARKAPAHILQYLNQVTEKRLRELKGKDKTDDIDIPDADATLKFKVLDHNFTDYGNINKALDLINMPSDRRVREDRCYVNVMSVEHKHGPGGFDMNSSMAIHGLGRGVGKISSMVCFNPKENNKKSWLPLYSEGLYASVASFEPKAMNPQEFEKMYQERVKTQLKRVRELRKDMESRSGAQRKYPSPK